LPSSTDAKRQLIEPGHAELSIRRQCELVGLNRSSWYYEPATESAFNLHLMRKIDALYLKRPFFGWRRMTTTLQKAGYPVNHKRIRRLMQKMGLQAIYPKHRTSQPGEGHKIYPYLLRNLAITGADQVWCADITYIPLRRGFMYLVAVMDWFSRYVLAWQLANTLDGQFCLDAVEQALCLGKPSVFNTDQGAQFTAHAFTSRLEDTGIRVSMDGKGRAMDNIMVERLWRTVKYEDIYIRDYETVPALYKGLGSYFSFYNRERFHQSLGNATPAEIHFGAASRSSSGPSAA
jgi:putative transposase